MIVISYIRISSHATDLGGMTLPPGVYKFDAAAALTGDLTLDANGDINATWVFQIGSALSLNENCAIRFTNDFGNADFIYWQVSSSAVISKKANIMGNIMADQSITLASKAVVLGRLLARIAAVTLDDNVVTMTSAQNASNNGGSFASSSTLSNSSSDGKSLSSGAVAGIIVGAVVFVACASGAIAHFVFGVGKATETTTGAAVEIATV